VNKKSTVYNRKLQKIAKTSNHVQTKTKQNDSHSAWNAYEFIREKLGVKKSLRKSLICYYQKVIIYNTEVIQMCVP
jgi:hypothetical protein